LALAAQAALAQRQQVPMRDQTALQQVLDQRSLRKVGAAAEMSMLLGTFRLLAGQLNMVNMCQESLRPIRLKELLLQTYLITKQEV